MNNMHTHTVEVTVNNAGFSGDTNVNLFYDDIGAAYESYAYAKKNLQDHIDRKNDKETSFAIEDMFGETTFETNRITRVRIIDNEKWNKNTKESLLLEKQMKKEIEDGVPNND